ncbi:MAG TPA: mechanosensitive ion channel protein MscS, partial [Thermodesulfobacteriota bacterium]|nr:mechanosensitive ion channel protein MscS [Thermodesulfobacteriota bacterium]
MDFHRLHFRYLLFPIVVLTFAGAAAAQPAADESRLILDHLNAAVGWYRHVLRLDVSAGLASDALYLQNARTVAHRAVDLAFQSAKEQAHLLEANSSPAAPPPDTPSDQLTDEQRIARAVRRASDRIKDIQSQIEGVNRELKTARGKKREDLLSRRDALEGKLDLEKALQDAIGRLSGVAAENARTGLAGRIQDLRQSVPDLSSADAHPEKGAANAAGSKSSRANASGLIGQAAILFSQMGDVRDIDELMAETKRVRAIAEKLQAPLRVSTRNLIQQGRSLADQPPTADPGQRESIHRTLDGLTAKFKTISAASIPLRQEILLLGQCNANLLEWRNSIEREYGRILRSLLTRVVVIVIALAVILFLSEVWRRATFRYIQEMRRRRQMLLLRQFATWFIVAIVVLLGFITEFSSLATFAGFLTAGIAVALQTVILSAAAYFFLIGRYGVRVGDRITVSGVTGDVINIGLVRMYMMELAGTGIDLYPTGRVVVFSNSVLFQATPLFKQIPGTAYAWHEAAVTLALGSDYAGAEKKLLEAVNSIFSEYQEAIERQHGSVETLTEVRIPVPSPQAQLHFIEKGLEVVIRYPVEI